MRVRRLLAPVLLSLLVGLSGAMATALPVAAADGDVVTTAKTVYRLDPAHGRINVAVDLVVSNHIANTVSYEPCIQYIYDPYWGPTPYSSTCPRTTRYYVNSTWTMVENAATNIRATSGGSRISVKKDEKGTYFRTLEFTFGRIWKGQSRRIHLTYTIPGGKPRSANSTRAMRAYTNFCATSHGIDGGRVEIRVPAAFDTSIAGSKLSSKVSGGTRIFSSGRISDWTTWFACIEGSNDAGYRTTTLTAPDGRNVTVKTWPEDPEWAAVVEASVSSGLGDLARLIGTDMRPDAPLIVKESVTGSEYAGFYSENSNTITVDEDFHQKALVEHELAHVWFNGGTFEDTWLAEGSAEWAARSVTHADPCRQPSGTPGSLSAWQYLTPKSTGEQRTAVDYQYDASCWVITKIATEAGAPGMTAATAALFSGTDPYALPADASAVSTKGTRPGPASWKRWLDVVDEVALQPAGAAPDFASDLLLQFGVTSDATILDARAAARGTYHDLADGVSWTVPTAIRSPLAAWDFAKAKVALGAAPAAWVTTGETDQVLADVDARDGPVADAWEAAETASDLQAAAYLAQTQLDAAIDVADAAALAAAPRDVIQQIGLIGATVPSIDPAIAAVREIDTAKAASVAASIRQSLAEATSAGQLRIGVGVTVAVLLLLAVAFVLVRRSRRRQALRLAMASAQADALVGTPSPTLDESPTIVLDGPLASAEQAADATQLEPGPGDPAESPPVD